MSDLANLGILVAGILGLLLFVALVWDRQWIRAWWTRQKLKQWRQPAKDIELVEQEPPPPAPPPRPRPRVFLERETLLITRYPLPRAPRCFHRDLPLSYQLEDVLVRGAHRTWFLDGRPTNLTDTDMADFLRTGAVSFAPRNAPVLRTVTTPPAQDWPSVRTEAVGSVYEKAPVVRLLKKESAPRTSRYDRILDEDDEDDDSGVHSKPKDP